MRESQSVGLVKKRHASSAARRRNTKSLRLSCRAAGRADALASLSEPHYLDCPPPGAGAVSHDIQRRTAMRIVV
jgi:hypothetical protein